MEISYIHQKLKSRYPLAGNNSMNIKAYPIFLLLLLMGCSQNENSDQELIEQETVEETENVIEESIDFENISNFSVSIKTPEKERDYSYHGQGIYGVFENPNNETSFKSEVKIEYLDNTNVIDVSKIKVKWSSNLDGVIFEGSVNEQLESNIGKLLSKGNHKIFCEAIIDDNPNFIVKDSLYLSNVISLELENTDRSVKLSWSKYLGEDFQSYLIYREGFEPITEITNVEITEFEDNGITLAEIKEFQVVVKTLSDEEIVSASNIESEEAGKYIRLPYFIEKAVNDGIRNKIYAIIGEDVTHPSYPTEYGLVILKNDSETVEVDVRILNEHRFSDLDMSPDGKYLFLCQRGVDKITRIDLDTFEEQRFDVAYGGWGVHKIEVGNDYRLYCARRPPTSGESPLYILDGLSGEQVGYYNWMIHGDIEFDIHSNKLYHGTSVREKQVRKFSVDNDIVVRETTFSPDINWPKPFILVSDNGNHVFWENYQLDKDLNIVREFDDPIIACNSDNSFISNGLRLIDFENLGTVFDYPNFPNFDASSEIFTNDNAMLFIKSSQPYTDERFTHLFKIKIE